MQYYFEKGVSEQDKLQLRSITQNVKHKIGISLGIERIMVSNIKEHYCKSISNIFNDPLIIICVSNDIFIIFQQFIDILNFLVNRNSTISNKQYYFAIDMMNNENINLHVFPLSKINYCSDSEMLQGYIFKITNCKINYVCLGNYKWIKCNANGSCKLEFSAQYDIIDQYNDFIKTCEDDNVKNISTTCSNTSINQSILLENLSLPEMLNIKVVKKSEIAIIKFTNISTFEKVTSYLFKRFGKGYLSCNVDLETEEEELKYIID